MYATAKKTKWLYIGNESRLVQWAGSLARLESSFLAKSPANPLFPSASSIIRAQSMILRDNLLHETTNSLALVCHV
jgi:hypothetical protein